MPAGGPPHVVEAAAPMPAEQILLGHSSSLDSNVAFARMTLCKENSANEGDEGE